MTDPKTRKKCSGALADEFGEHDCRGQKRSGESDAATRPDHRRRPRYFDTAGDGGIQARTERTSSRLRREVGLYWVESAVTFAMITDRVIRALRSSEALPCGDGIGQRPEPRLIPRHPA